MNVVVMAIDKIELETFSRIRPLWLCDTRWSIMIDYIAIDQLHFWHRKNLIELPNLLALIVVAIHQGFRDLLKLIAF